jgi:predicted transcriptional regulator of viral defense system
VTERSPSDPDFDLNDHRRRAAAERRILRALAEYPAASVEEVSHHTGLNLATIEPLLARLLTKGRITRVRRGRYLYSAAEESHPDA